MKYTPVKRRPLAMAIASLSIVAVHPAYTLAQDNDKELEEVIVTGSRRSESLQDVAINISAVGGETIQELRLNDISKIANFIPGLTVVDRGPRDEVADVFVRGLNTSGLGPGFTSDTVAIYMGDIPLQADFNPVDLQRVEVLKGPQGTLYGQGTMGGAIRYIPFEADAGEFSASFRAGTSINKESDDFGHSAGLTLNIPLISDVLALRTNVDTLYDPGFIDYNFVVREPGVSNPQPDFSNDSEVAANLRRVADANGEDSLSARVNLRWQPDDFLDLNLWYFLEDTEAEGRQINHQLAFGTGRYESGLRFVEPNDYKYQLYSLDLNIDLGFAEATFVRGVTTYDEVGQRDQSDLLLGFEFGYEDFPSFSAFTRETAEIEADTAELRLSSTTDHPIQWTFGYFYNASQQDAVSEEFTPGFDQFAVDNLGGVQLRPDALEYIQLTDNYEKEKAFYGEISYAVTQQLTLTLGARSYEFEVDAGSGFGLPLLQTVFEGASPTEVLGFVDISRSQSSDDGDLFKLNLAYDLNEDNLLYLTYSEGYRNGGANPVPACPPESSTPEEQLLCGQPDELLFNSDSIDNYELGYKGNALENTLSYNAALYYIDWQNVQVDAVTQFGNLPITGNGETAVSRGLELDGRWLINDQLQATFSYAYTNAKITANSPGLVGNFTALSGARLPGHADHQASLNFTYVMDFLAGDLAINYSAVYVGGIYNGVGGPKDPLIDESDPQNVVDADFGLEEIPSYNINNVSATYNAEDWSLQLYADNLFNEFYITGTRTSRRFLVNEQTGPGILAGDFTLRSYGQFVGTPRTIGVNFTYNL